MPRTSDWRCPTCGRRYADERGPLTFAEAYALAFKASEEANDRHEYGTRAGGYRRRDGTRGRPRGALALMHEAKRGVWEFHLAECAAAAEIEPEAFTPPGDVPAYDPAW